MGINLGCYPDASQNIQVKFATDQFSIAYLLISSPLLLPILSAEKWCLSISVHCLSIYRFILSCICLYICLLLTSAIVFRRCSDLEVSFGDVMDGDQWGIQQWRKASELE
ncbi:hypothetical protein NC653_016318 [Populus alba x Populus x berolinensis]|uniref:Uncharacterized protein n=1 Tax=Populus alba x Populus x berolinensis TaxID=444605 RepID=A0AAD6VZJ7_9ROSI|nr:hypothetical protein NC653_016318 [Populus alba x Populus x berolinensis]